MTITKWNPFFPDVVKDRFNRLLGRDDFWRLDEPAVGNWAPAVDVVENDNALTIKAELPGFDAKDVAITVENNVLTLKGERRFEDEVKKEHYHRLERAYGTFARGFTLPGNVDADNIKAEFKNGLLIVTLPKKASFKGKAIEVKAA
jgi:HSP20 family protein